MTDSINVASSGERVGFWRRVAAYLIDSFALGLVGGVISSVSDIGILIYLVITIAYFIYFWSAAGGGQTLGMRALSIRVIKEDGSPLDYGTAIVRYLGLGLSILALYIGVIWVAFDANKQGWHDKLAKTYVVRA